MTTNVGDDRILPETRAVAALVIPFLAAAFVILYLFPSDTERLFAWKFQPAMSAMMLAAAYAGGIHFFGSALLAREWHTIKVGLPPTMIFASILGVATILHWDRFTHNHISFYAWAGLYFTTPFILLAILLRNRSHESRQIKAGAPEIGRMARFVIGAIGALTLIMSALLFVVPAVLIELWPWPLTPLTARVMSAMFALPALVGLGIAFDSRWSAARVILQSQSLSLVLILLALARSWGEFDTTRPTIWIFTAGMAAILAVIVTLYLFMQTRVQQNIAA